MSLLTSILQTIWRFHLAMASNKRKVVGIVTGTKVKAGHRMKDSTNLQTDMRSAK